MDTKKKKKCLGHIGTVLTYIILGFAVIAALFPLAWVASTSIKPGNEVFSNPPYWIPKMPTLSNYLLVLTESSIPLRLPLYWDIKRKSIRDFSVLPLHT